MKVLPSLPLALALLCAPLLLACESRDVDLLSRRPVSEGADLAAEAPDLAPAPDLALPAGCKIGSIGDGTACRTGSDWSVDALARCTGQALELAYLSHDGLCAESSYRIMRVGCCPQGTTGGCLLIEKNSVCQSEPAWRAAAQAACAPSRQARDVVVSRPCGADVYTGVSFSCCP